MSRRAYALLAGLLALIVLELGAVLGLLAVLVFKAPDDPVRFGSVSYGPVQSVTIAGADGGGLVAIPPATSVLAYGQTTITGGATAAQLAPGVTCTGGMSVTNLDATNVAWFGKDASTTTSTGEPVWSHAIWNIQGSLATGAQPYWYAPTTLVLSWECYQ